MFKLLTDRNRSKFRSVPPSGYYNEFAAYFGLFEDDRRLDGMIKDTLSRTLNYGLRSNIGDNLVLCRLNHLSCVLGNGNLISYCLNLGSGSQASLSIKEVMVWDKSLSTMAFVNGAVINGKQICFLACDFAQQASRYQRIDKEAEFELCGLAISAEPWSRQELEQLGLTDKFCDFSLVQANDNPHLINVLGRVVAINNRKEAGGLSFKIITMQMFCHRDRYQTLTFWINTNLQKQPIAIGDCISVNMCLFGALV